KVRQRYVGIGFLWDRQIRNRAHYEHGKKEAQRQARAIYRPIDEPRHVCVPSTTTVTSWPLATYSWPTVMIVTVCGRPLTHTPSAPSEMIFTGTKRTRRFWSTTRTPIVPRSSSAKMAGEIR